MHLKQAKIYFCSHIKNPTLEIKEPSGKIRRVSFKLHREQAGTNKIWWLAKPTLKPEGEWSFRINAGDDIFITPAEGDFFSTPLRTLWVQDGQIFSYQPGSTVSPSKVIKAPEFSGQLSERALYIYLPRGYAEHTERAYPVIYMHDGQNCFERFVSDSYAGSWRADEVADRTISAGRMRECIIVGVSNGGKRRMAEYMPLYTLFKMPPSGDSAHTGPELIAGRANQTLAYYRDDVDRYIAETYRILPGRENKATCGSSMGGLFSAFIAWEYPDFARQHAIMSASFWVTRNEQGQMETIERFRTGIPRDVRLWLDSGTGDSDNGDDGMAATILARDALLQNGYRLGPDFQYYLDEGGAHHESTWARRLDKVFAFLFPVR